MKNTVKCLLILLVAAGCASKKDTSKNIEAQIEAKANACTDTAKCGINIADLTTFEWDNVYVFNDVQPKEYIELAISTKYPDYEEGTRPLIFMNKGQIVYSENNPDGLIAGTPGQVIYSYKPGLKYFAFARDKALFKVKVEKTKGKTFYEMFQQ